MMARLVAEADMGEGLYVRFYDDGVALILAECWCSRCGAEEGRGAELTPEESQHLLRAVWWRLSQPERAAALECIRAALEGREPARTS